MKPEAFILIGTLGGALIGALSSIISNLVIKRIESKTHEREMLLKYAFEEWSVRKDWAEEKGGIVSPAYLWVAHYRLMLDAIFSSNNEEELMQKISQADQTVSKISSFIKQKRKSN